MLTPDIIECATKATEREFPGVRFFVVFHEGLVYVVDGFWKRQVAWFKEEPGFDAQTTAGNLILQLEHQRLLNNN